MLNREFEGDTKGQTWKAEAMATVTAGMTMCRAISMAQRTDGVHRPSLGRDDRGDKSRPPGWGEHLGLGGIAGDVLVVSVLTLTIIISRQSIGGKEQLCESHITKFDLQGSLGILEYCWRSDQSSEGTYTGISLASSGGSCVLSQSSSFLSLVVLIDVTQGEFFSHPSF